MIPIVTESRVPDPENEGGSLLGTFLALSAVACGLLASAMTFRWPQALWIMAMIPIGVGILMASANKTQTALLEASLILLGLIGLFAASISTSGWKGALWTLTFSLCVLVYGWSRTRPGGTL